MSKSYSETRLQPQQPAKCAVGRWYPVFLLCFQEEGKIWKGVLVLELWVQTLQGLKQLLWSVHFCFTFVKANHPEVPETAVIGYPHKIKGEGM